jgi:DNA-binding PadR family transcriptional regulator
MTDLVVLAALLRGPAYGYELKKTAGLMIGDKAMHPNVVYPMLKSFAQHGWVVQRAAPGERGQTRKQYRMTPAGKSRLMERLRAFGEQEAASEAAFLLRVALFDALPKPARMAILAARDAFLERRFDRLSALGDETRPRAFAAVVLDHVRDQVDKERRWIRNLKQLAASGERG